MNDFIRTHWDAQAEKYGTSHEASWGDIYAIQLEIATIGQFIKEGDVVLDVGCANGFSTLQQMNKKPQKIIGIDSSTKMIEQARKNKIPPHSVCEVIFHPGTARSIPYENNIFDVVYTTRTLINLPTWEEQKEGIHECLRVCKSTGTVILCEAFWEPLVLLNALRALKSLPALVEHDFNRYLKKNKLEELLGLLKLTFQVIEFSSVYYLGSRFLRELVTNPDDYPGYSNPINELYFEIEKKYSGGGFGIQQAYVISKS
jgi:ubiquinone/menaquinone biosynthesis C-methylase UbiE